MQDLPFSCTNDNGTPLGDDKNVDRLMSLSRKHIKIGPEKECLARTICREMKIVYRNENEELKVLFNKFKIAGIIEAKI